jgi:Ethanolamine utilization protein EutJ (predicted chaperonin)
MRVLEEPTAAAIAYGLHQKPNVHHILVYDFGGGTLDVSLLYVHEGFVTVEGVDGDDHLGGTFGWCPSSFPPFFPPFLSFPIWCCGCVPFV